LSTIDASDELRELARAVRFNCEDVCEFGLQLLDDYIARPHPTVLLNAANLFALAGRRVRAMHDQIHGGDGTVLSLAEPAVAGGGGRARGADPPVSTQPAVRFRSDC
jgi:hypothetical protein